MPASMEAISGFEAFLSSAGFECVRREPPPGSISVHHIEYASREIRVRVVHKGGVWKLEIADRGMYTDNWYEVVLFTYLLGGPRRPDMSLEEQLEYAQAHWSRIVEAFASGGQYHSHRRLRGAIREHARKVLDDLRLRSQL